VKRILIVDDHPIVRDGLKRLVEQNGEMSVAGEAGNAAEALRRLRAAEWDVVVLDLSLPGRSGLDLLADVRRLRPKTPVLVLTMHGEDDLAIRAFRGGAAGYLTKDRAAAELLRALKLVLTGQKYISRTLTDKLLEELQTDAAPAHKKLSNREYEILTLIASGRSVKEIASVLLLSRSTVSTYRRRILQKMGLKTNADLTRYAVHRRLVE